MMAFEALASVTSDSLIAPTPPWMIRTTTSSFESFSGPYQNGYGTGAYYSGYRRVRVRRPVSLFRIIIGIIVLHALMVFALNACSFIGYILGGSRAAGGTDRPQQRQEQQTQEEPSTEPQYYTDSNLDA